MGFDHLSNYQPAAAIADITPAFVAAARKPNDAREAAQYLTLIGHGFGLDGNVRAYRQCARMALLLAPDDPITIGFNIQADLRALDLEAAAPLVAANAALAEKNSYVARQFSEYYRFRGEADKVEHYLNVALRLNPDDPQAYALYGRHVAHTPEDTSKYFRLAAEHCTPGSFRREMFLWGAERSEKKDKASTEHVDNAAKLLPDEPSWKFSKAFWLMGHGKQKEAIDLFISASNAPTRLSLRALSQCATYCAYNKMPKTAMKAANRVVEAAPDLPESYLCRGHIVRQLGDLTAAERDYRKALEINPHYSMAYEALRDFPEYKNGKQAEWLAKEWAANCPEKADALLAAADRARLVDKDYARAIELYDRAEQRLTLAKKPTDKTVFTHCRVFAGKGTAAYLLGNFEIATACARAFNDRRPEPAAALIRVRPAKIDFAKIARGSQTELAAQHGALADMLYEGGNLDDCIEEYKKAIAQADNPEWHRGLLKAYMDKGDYRSATSEDLVVSNNTVTRDLPGAIERLRKQLGH